MVINMANIQLLPLRPDRDCDSFIPALRDSGKGKRFVIDCNGLTGVGCNADDLDEVLTAMAAAGWHRVSDEKGSPESVSTVYLK